MYPINFPIINLWGWDGHKSMGLDDNLATAMAFNTAKWPANVHHPTHEKIWTGSCQLHHVIVAAAIKKSA